MRLEADYSQRIIGLEAENARLIEINRNLSAQVQWFKNQLFGTKSERRVVDSAEQQLYLGEQFQDRIEKTGADTQVIAEHKRRKRRERLTDGDGENLFFDETVPVEEIKVKNTEIEGLSENEYEVVSQKASYRLAQRPGSYVIIKYVRDVIKIKSDDNNKKELVCAKAPVSVFEKSHADVSFLAGLLIDKFQYHLPLYRQHQRLGNAGIDVSRPWLTQLVHRSGDLLEPIFNKQLEMIRKSRVKILDETPIKAGRKEKGKMRAAYFWPVLGEDKEIAFVYCDTREYHHVFEVLGEKPGSDSVVVSDGYGAYKNYATITKTLNAQCWAHSRREFLKANIEEPERVEKVLELIRQLYAIEKEIKSQNLEGKHKRFYRLENSKPIVDKIFAWVEQKQKDQSLLPSNLFLKALNYADKRKEELSIFLTDPEVPIDTNEIENAIRPIPLGRKNWLFCWTEVGAKYVGIIQSLISTCKMHEIDPYTYLVDVLQRVATHPKSEIEQLTPRLWKQYFMAAPLRSDLDNCKQIQ